MEFDSALFNSFLGQGTDSKFRAGMDVYPGQREKRDVKRMGDDRKTDEIKLVFDSACQFFDSRR